MSKQLTKGQANQPAKPQTNTQTNTQTKAITHNVFTPETVIALREKYPVVGTLFTPTGKTTQNARKTTSYTKFKCVGLDGKSRKFVFKFANQLLARDASPYEGKKESGVVKRDDDKPPSSVQLCFRKLDAEMLELTDYPDKEHSALIECNSTYIRAIEIINEELEFFQDRHVINGDDEMIITGSSKKFTGLIVRTRGLNSDEKETYKKDGKKVKDVKVPLEKPLYQFKLSAAFGFGSKIGKVDYETKKFKENVFDLKSMAKYRNDHPKESPKAIPLSIGKEPLTIENVRKGLTRMSKVSGVVSIDAITSHGFGTSPSMNFDSLFVQTHSTMKNNYVDEIDMDEYTNGIDITTTDENTDMIEEPVQSKPAKPRMPLLVAKEDDDDEPNDNLDDTQTKNKAPTDEVLDESNASEASEDEAPKPTPPPAKPDKVDTPDVAPKRAARGKPRGKPKAMQVEEESD